MKFVETLVLLYTPDPYISADPPQEPVYGNYEVLNSEKKISYFDYPFYCQNNEMFIVLQG